MAMYNVIRSDSALASIISRAVHTNMGARRMFTARDIPLEPDRLRGLNEIATNERPDRMLQRARDIQRFGGEDPGATPRPRNRWTQIFDEISIEGRPGEIIVNNGEIVAVIHEERGGLVYIEKNGGAHNIITDGKWTYPALVHIVQSVRTDGKYSANIIICKRQIAKKLVYSKLYKFIEIFNSDILNNSNFHLLNSKNCRSYVAATTSKLYTEIDRAGNEIYVDDEKLLATSNALLHNLTAHYERTYIVTCVKTNLIMDGKVICWPEYIHLSLQSAKKLVYWSKNNKKVNEPSQFSTFVTNTNHDSRYFRYGGRTIRAASSARSTGPVENGPRVERVEDVVEAVDMAEPIAEPARLDEIQRNDMVRPTREVIDDIADSNREAREGVNNLPWSEVGIVGETGNERHRSLPIIGGERPIRESRDDAREGSFRRHEEGLAREFQNVEWGAVVERQILDDVHREEEIDDGEDQDGPEDQNE